MTVHADHHLHHQRQTAQCQQNSREDGVCCPCLPVLADAAGEGNDDDDVRGEGVARVAVKKDEVGGDEHHDFCGQHP